MAESDKEIIPRASNEIDPYDSNYPAALLAKSVGSSLEKADRAAEAIIAAVSKDASLVASNRRSLYERRSVRCRHA